MLQYHTEPTEYLIDRVPEVGIDENVVAPLNLDEYVERRRSFSFEDGLLSPSSSCFHVAECDRLYSADEVG